MEIFAHSANNYSVEEISYEDMMSLISGQNQGSHDLGKEETNSSKTPAAITMAPKTMAPKTMASKTPASNQDDFSQRIAENAKMQLPDWLSSH